MEKPYLSIIIPAYNEAERLPITLVDMDKKLREKPWTYEILVVNDGSKDATADIVQKMAKTIKNLKLVDNTENKGKGGVVRQGMLLARGEYRLFMDADNSTTVDQFERMIPEFDTGAQVVIGSRAHKESKLEPAQPIYRQIPGKMGNLFIQLLLLPGLWDTQCGFKAFTAEAAERVFVMSKIIGWGFDVEILALAKACGYVIREVPVRWVNDLSSRIGMSAYVQVLLETIKIRLWLWRGKYPLK